jgi:biotin carboxylase
VHRPGARRRELPEGRDHPRSRPRHRRPGIHPGYGFLSENPDFSDACEAAGIAFIGPTRAQMLAFGLKHTARELAEQAGVPLLPGSGLLDDVAHARREAARIGYPVMLKSTAAAAASACA